MYLIDPALVALALLGYTGLVVHVTNRLRATSISRHIVGPISDALLLSVPVLSLLIVAIYLVVLLFGNVSFADGPVVLQSTAAIIILTPCWLFAVVVLPIKLIAFVRIRHSARAVVIDRKLRDLAQDADGPLITGWKAHLAGRFFRNEITLLETADVRLDLPGLDPAFAGLTITHLSDLHFTGRMTKEYFERAVAVANEKQSDLAVVTGDIIDRLDKISWLPDTLGRLRAKYGVYVVMGNHDYEFNQANRIRQSLLDAGLKHLGGQVISVECNGGTLVLAGNEAPWGPLPTQEAIAREFALSENSPLLKILLSHSPDQFPWAQATRFDLVLAGHTHGGQIHLPLWGPLVCPSKFGLRYVGGCYFEDPTLMYVTRGVSARTPIRLNCPPELPRYILRES